MGLQFRFGQSVIEGLFPSYYYRKKCLSLNGFENDKGQEKDFRKKLGIVLQNTFSENPPTVCCCINKLTREYEVVLTLHKREGQDNYNCPRSPLLWLKP